MRVCMCVSLCLPSRLLMTSGIILTPYRPVASSYLLVQLIIILLPNHECTGTYIYIAIINV